MVNGGTQETGFIQTRIQSASHKATELPVILNDAQELTYDNIATLKDLHEQLQRKQELISWLDAKILEATTDEEEIEAEVLQTEEINSSISTAKAKITQRLMSTISRVGKNSGPRDQEIHGNPTLLGTFYTSQYSILVLDTSASSLAWPIHFFPPHSVSHDVYTN